MDAQTFLDNFARITDAPGGVQRLRDVVLDLAVTGRLVTQNREEGTAKELMAGIPGRRESMISDGIIRKPRHPKDVPVEDPAHAIPPTWTWARLGDVGAIVGGGTPASSESKYWADGTGVPWLTPADMRAQASRRVERGARDITARGLSESSAQLLPAGSVLFSSRAPIGHVGIAARPLATNQGFKSCVPYVSDMTEYLYVFLKQVGRHVDATATGTTFKEVSGKEVSLIPIPVPPIAEQKRIVAKVDELMGLCDALEARSECRHRANIRCRGSALHALTEADTLQELREAWERVSINWPALTEYPDSIPVLRETILGLAVGGGLPSGSAQKWIRCSLGDQITLQRGFDITKSQQHPGPYPVVSSGGVLSYHSEAACTGPGVVIGRKGSVGRVHWVPEDYWPHDTTLWVKDFHGNEPEFVYWFLRSFSLLDYESSTANPSLNRNRLHPVKVAWPALELQPDLVQQIRRAFELCDRLESAIGERGRVGSALAHSLMRS